MSATTIARSSLVPIVELLGEIRCFDGFPHDTYFSDVAINFTNYGQINPAPLDVEIIEILGPVSEGVFRKVDFGHLTRVPGLHLVFDAAGPVCRPNFWYHVDRFSSQWVRQVADRFIGLLSDHLELLLR
jgi:hypothetical protein